jgi:hypothetical protein
MSLSLSHSLSYCLPHSLPLSLSRCFSLCQLRQFEFSQFSPLAGTLFPSTLSPNGVNSSDMLTRLRLGCAICRSVFRLSRHKILSRSFRLWFKHSTLLFSRQQSDLSGGGSLTQRTFLDQTNGTPLVSEEKRDDLCEYISSLSASLSLSLFVSRSLSLSVSLCL